MRADPPRLLLRVGVWPARNGNPFTEAFSAALDGAGVNVVHVATPTDLRPDEVHVLHIHWPEQLFWAGAGRRAPAKRVVRTIAHLWRLKLAGLRIVWMVHNLQPHDLPPWQRTLWLVLRHQLCLLADGFMALSPATVDVVRAGIPGLRRKPATFGWMPAYQQSASSGAEVRARLGVRPDTRLFGFFGQVRPYKGIESLIAAFRDTELAEADLALVVAGTSPDDDYLHSLGMAAAGDPRIRFVDRRLSDAEYGAYQRAADVVVLPFARYLHSSSILHALSDGRPVLTPDTPFAYALSGAVGCDWVQLYSGALNAYTLLQARAPEGRPRLDQFTAEALAKRALAFYLTVRNPARHHGVP